VKELLEATVHDGDVEVVTVGCCCFFIAYI